MMGCCVKGHFGFVESFHADKGSSTSQIAGVVAFPNLWLILFAHLFYQEPEPIVSYLQFLLIVFVVVVGLGHTVVDITQRTDICLLVLHQFCIVLKGLDSRLCLLHVQIDYTYLLVGHRASQFIVALLGIIQHVLSLLKGLLQLSLCTQGIGLQLPGAIEVIPLIVFAKPLHLDVGLSHQLLHHREVFQGDNLLPTGLTLLIYIAHLLLLGYQRLHAGEGLLSSIATLCLTCKECKSPCQKANHC